MFHALIRVLVTEDKDVGTAWGNHRNASYPMVIIRREHLL